MSEKGQEKTLPVGKIAIATVVTAATGIGLYSFFKRSKQDDQQIAQEPSAVQNQPPAVQNQPPAVVKKSFRVEGHSKDFYELQDKTRIYEFANPQGELFFDAGIQRLDSSPRVVTLNLASLPQPTHKTADAILREMDQGDYSSLFSLPAGSKIHIRKWQDVYDLSGLLFFLFLHAIQPKKEGEEYVNILRNFFRRNTFVVDEDSDVFQDQFATLAYLTSPTSSLAFAAIKATGSKPNLKTESDQYNLDYMRHFGCIPTKYPSLSMKGIEEGRALLADGLLLLFEHAMIRASNFLAVIRANPTATKSVEEQLLKIASPLLVAGGKALLAAMGIGAAVPVAGWIAAAVAAAVAAVIAIFDFVGQLNRREELNLKWQESMQPIAEDVWGALGRVSPLSISLLGSRLGLITDDPSYALDSRTRSYWLRNYVIVRGGWYIDPCNERVFPQIPYFVRQFPYPLVYQFALDRDHLRAIRPRDLERAYVPEPFASGDISQHKGNRHVRLNWDLPEYKFSDLKSVVGILGITK